MFDLYFQSEIWSTVLFSNTYQDYVVVLAGLVVLLIVLAVFHNIVLSYMKRIASTTKNDIDDAMIQVIKTIKPSFYIFLALWISLNYLTVHPLVQKILNAILVIWLVAITVRAVQIFISYVIEKKIDNGKNEATQSMIALVNQVVKIILWSFGFLLILSNLGVDVTSLIAGLGIGGIAIALAAQGMLGDLFSSFVIYFDKPFAPGDYITVGDIRGTVEKVGIKSTRIRSLTGEEIVISNEKLTSSIIHNFKKLQRRRMTFSFGITYETPLKKLKNVSDLVKKVIDGLDDATFDRAVFNELGDSALIFDVVYYIEGPSIDTFMQLHSEINEKIKELFDKEKIDFAYPTTVQYTINK